MMGVPSAIFGGVLIIDSEADNCGPGLTIEFVGRHNGTTYNIQGNVVTWQ